MRPTSAAPAADSGRPSERASMSAGARPARRVAPVIDPAEVPTMTSARRASQPIASWSAASTPPWNAPPATPPAPSTNATLDVGVTLAWYGSRSARYGAHVHRTRPASSSTVQTLGAHREDQGRNPVGAQHAVERGGDRARSAQG